MRQFFDTIGNRQSAWKAKADALLLAANVLIERHEIEMEKYDDNDRIADSDGWTTGNKSPVLKYMHLTWPSLMLLAFSLECFMKATWLAKGGTLAEDGEYKAMPGGRNHDLGSMYGALGYQIAADEESVLRRLTAIATAHGRYPIPMRHTKYLSFDESGSVSMKWDFKRDNIVVNTIIDRLLEEIDA